MDGWPRQGVVHGGGDRNWGKFEIPELGRTIKGGSGCYGFGMT
jgi:hypothetical protein